MVVSDSGVGVDGGGTHFALACFFGGGTPMRGRGNLGRQVHSGSTTQLTIKQRKRRSRQKEKAFVRGWMVGLKRSEIEIGNKRKRQKRK